MIMVTHNPELAQLYSTRIVRLQDGLVVADSNPFPLDGRENIEVPVDEAEVLRTNQAVENRVIPTFSCPYCKEKQQADGVEDEQVLVCPACKKQYRVKKQTRYLQKTRTEEQTEEKPQKQSKKRVNGEK